MIQFDKSFLPVVQYEKYRIYIFMNINENLKMSENHWVEEHIGHFIMDVNLFSEATEMQKNIVLKINAFWLYEISWFPWQPIM